MRCVCDSTYVLDQKTRHDTKVDEVMGIISDIVESGDEKVVVFSQWERMTRLVAEELEKRGIGFEYLHGGVPSAKRKDLVNNFTDDPDSRVFLSTDAGSTGLNLQVASTVVNIDLPWNPAVLEQRIARIYRIGQKRNIQVVNLVSANSFEEAMLGKLRFKASLFAGVLDNGQDTIFASDGKFNELMKDIQSTLDDAGDDTARPVAADELEPAAGASPALGQDNLLDGEDSPQEEDRPSAAGRQEAEDALGADPMLAQPQGRDNGGGIAASGEDAPRPARSHRSPRQLVAEGVSFLTGLTKTLESPQATRELVDSLVEVDQDTGETNLRIPVPDKDSVEQVLGALGRLFKQLGGQQ